VGELAGWSISLGGRECGLASIAFMIAVLAGSFVFHLFLAFDVFNRLYKHTSHIVYPTWP
jgi:hypothetical protein